MLFLTSLFLPIILYRRRADIGRGLLIGWHLGGVLIDVLMIEPIAWVLERESLNDKLRKASLLFIVIGFHFDYLAS